MGKLVEAIRVGYYGNVRQRVGDQFVMADSAFEKEVPVLVDGEPKLDKDGKPEMKKEKIEPSWVAVVEDGYDDPVFETEAEIKKKAHGKPQKRQAVKKQADDHRQGGAFDVDTASGIQITGQIPPARPAASSFVADPLPPAPAKEGKKGSGDKSVL